MGTILAWGLYSLLKLGEYETANPGQDFNDQEAQLFDAPSDPVSASEVARPNVVAAEAERVVAQATQEIVRNLSSPTLEGEGRESMGLRPLVSGERETKIE